jgi:hypothetical protein
MPALRLAWRRAVARRRRPGDRGAVAVTVGILLSGGVLLGFTALVVDVGQLYAEREELQSGADAGALAVAAACATQTIDGCISGDRVGGPNDDVYDTAEKFADRNALDGRANVLLVCGRDPGNRLNDCDYGQSNNFARCIGSPPPAPQPYVEVRLQTETRSGSFVLPPVFAQTLGGGTSGGSAGACARASWSEPNRQPVAFALSMCEFAEATENGYTTPPNWTDDDEYVIFVHSDSLGTSCDDQSPPSGWERPGRFGWIADRSNGCVADGSDLRDGVLHTVPGNSWGDCDDQGNSAGRLRQLRGTTPPNPPDYTVVLIPIVDGCQDPGNHNNDCNNGTGGDSELHLAGFAPFVITGYRENGSGGGGGGGGGDRIQSWQTGNDPCDGGGEGCISGFFVGPLQRTNDPSAAFGARPSIIG